MEKLMKQQYQTRMGRLREKLAEKGLTGVLIAPGANLRYYTGGNSLLVERPFFMIVPTDGEPRLVTPTLEAGPYVRCPLKIAIHQWTDTEGPSKAIRDAITGLDWEGGWGVEGSMPYGFLNALQEEVQSHFDNADPILQGIRSVKDSEELRLLTRSAHILSKTFLEIPSMLKAGMSEIELAQEILRKINSNGAESAPDVLVQSGPMTADSHHLPSARRIRRKESIVVDATCTYGGYFADITRTLILGKDREFQSLYETLHDAQVAAVKAAQTGVPVGSIDGAARSFLRDSNLGGFFTHRTGHGLGLSVHEQPYIVEDGTEFLRPGMAFTVEPGIYMRGKTGLRIEDDIITRKTNGIVLTKAVPKEFGWWN